MLYIVKFKTRLQYNIDDFLGIIADIKFREKRLFSKERSIIHILGTCYHFDDKKYSYEEFIEDNMKLFEQNRLMDEIKSGIIQYLKANEKYNQKVNFVNRDELTVFKNGWRRLEIEIDES